jgi:hypothetical protein
LTFICTGESFALVGLNPLKKSSGTATEAVTIAPSEHTREPMVSGFETRASNKNGDRDGLTCKCKKVDKPESSRLRKGQYVRVTDSRFSQ